MEQPRAGEGTPDSKRIPYRRLLSDPTVIGNYLGHFAAHWALAAGLTWLSAYLQTGLGYPAITAGRMFALFIVITAPVSLGLAWWSQRLLARGWPSRLARSVFIGVVLIVAGGLLCSVSLLNLSNVQKFILLALGSGMALVMNSVGPAILGEIIPHSQRGAMPSFGNAVASLSGLGAPVVMGWLIQISGGGSSALGFERGFFINGVMLALGGLASLALMNPQKSCRRLWAPSVQRTAA